MDTALVVTASPGPDRPASPSSLACYGPGVEFLLTCKTFSCDVLLIAAEACDELEIDLGCRAMVEAASAAADLARRLRAEAPRRHAAPLCGPLPLRDRAILAQIHARERGEIISDGEALFRAERDEKSQAQPDRVAGGCSGSTVDLGSVA